MSIRVALVDDQALVRSGFRMIVEGQPDMEVVVEAADGLEAVSETARTRSDVVLMDIRMPHMDGIDARGASRRWMTSTPACSSSRPTTWTSTCSEACARARAGSC
jgi:DNA-binding NarL/FixJ family response regulator